MKTVHLLLAAVLALTTVACGHSKEADNASTAASLEAVTYGWSQGEISPIASTDWQGGVALKSEATGRTFIVSNINKFKLPVPCTFDAPCGRYRIEGYFDRNRGAVLATSMLFIGY